MAAEHDILADELIRAVELLSDCFASRSTRYAIVGGLATLMRGRLRFTHDVDVLLDVPQVALPGLLEVASPTGFRPGYDHGAPRVCARTHDGFSLRLRADRLVKARIAPLRAHDRERLAVTLDGRPHSSRGHAEGLILTKLVSFRPQDQVDIETLLIANRDEIDVDFIRREWSAVAVGEEARTAWLEDAIKRFVPARP